MVWKSRGEYHKGSMHVCDLEGAPGSCLQISLASAIASIWGGSQWMEDLAVSLCISLYLLCLSVNLHSSPPSPAPKCLDAYFLLRQYP